MNDEHANTAALLAVYRDLSPAERQRVAQHLAGCAECRATFAAYQHQDVVLAGLPALQSARPWQPAARRRPSPARQWLGHLGNALVAGGLAALLALVILQAQTASQWASQPGGSPPPEVFTEPGIAIPPTRLAPPSPWLAALPWVGGALLAVGGLFVLSRQSLWAAAGCGLVAALLLVSFVPPLSALPNPVGLYWRLRGGYGYAPGLPFRNEWVIAGRPEEQLRPRLDALIGAVGLSPLDPVQPLASYEILRVGLHPTHNRTALITTRFIYADGSSRVYPVPLFEPALDIGGFWLSGWQADGLERLRSQHLDLPGQPFAGPDAPVRVGDARRLDSLSPAAHRLDEANPGHWRWDSVRVQRLVWAPDGRSFLALIEQSEAVRHLWQVRLDGASPVLLATGPIFEYGWAPAGETVVYTQFDQAAAQVRPEQPFAISAVQVAGASRPVVIVTGLPNQQLPGLTRSGIWFFTEENLWLASYAGGPPRLAGMLPADQAALTAPWPSPDETLVAFGCRPGVCLLPVTLGGETERPALVVSGPALAEAAWSPAGDHLAVVDRDPNGLRPIGLLVFNRDGAELFAAKIAPGDVTDSPQWTPDGDAILIQTYPRQGRRIIAVHLPSGQVLDLSQEHWDAYFALAPDGRSLLLNNGRGDFWAADLLRQAK